MFAERKTRDGILIKVPIPYQPPSLIRTGAGAHSSWVRKVVWIWTQQNGPVPPGHAITTIDGDETNCDPDNIVCVPRGVLAQMNRPSAPRNPEMRPERLRLAQLHQALREKRASNHPEAQTPSRTEKTTECLHGTRTPNRSPSRRYAVPRQASARKEAPNLSNGDLQ